MNDTLGYPDPGLDLSDGFKPHTSHWGVFSARHSEAGLEVSIMRGILIRMASSTTFPARSATRRASPSRRSAAAGSSADPAPMIAAAATSSSP